MDVILFIFNVYAACKNGYCGQPYYDIELNENPDAKGTEVVDFKLVHKGGNEYKGVIDLIIPNPVADLMNTWSEQDILKENIEVTYVVEVIYDGESYSWEIIRD